MPKADNSLDQFYTKRETARDVISMINCDEFDLIIEPSAGAGDFLYNLPEDRSIGIDLDPAGPKIRKGDFFNFVPCVGESILTIGNPPYGKNSSLAVKFFNHAAQYSSCIAFILPRTFRKPSVINRLNQNFILDQQKILPLKAFYTPDGESYSVPTVFQIWRKSVDKRKKIHTILSHEDFSFVKIKQNPSQQDKQNQINNSDFCIRRVGASAGKLYTDYRKIYRDWKSHYYIKQNVIIAKEIFASIEWDSLESPKFDTAGNPSISKHDLIKHYDKRKKEYELQIKKR